jgi:hypothetical protein
MVSFDVRAEARTYLRCKGKGRCQYRCKGKGRCQYRCKGKGRCQYRGLSATRCALRSRSRRLVVGEAGSSPSASLRAGMTDRKARATARAKASANPGVSPLRRAKGRAAPVEMTNGWAGRPRGRRGGGAVGGRRFGWVTFWGWRACLPGRSFCSRRGSRRRRCRASR